MRRRTKIGLAVAVVALVLSGWYVYQRTHTQRASGVAEMIALLPGRAETVAYVDAAAWRGSPFFARLVALAPKQPADADYAGFVRATGFDYERDLDRIALAILRSGGQRQFFAVVDGRFDRKKLTEYAMRAGIHATSGGHEIFTVPVSGSERRLTFSFLNEERLVVTDDAGLASLLQPQPDAGTEELRVRGLRLAGSPLFAIFRPEAMASAAHTAPAPGGVRLDQLQAMAASLRWATLAVRPQGDRLQIIAEGECASDDAARQLASTLNGLLLLARIALDDPKSQRQMDPATHEALLDTLTRADVSRMDRGETKSVRLVVELSSRLLDAAQQSSAPNPTVRTY